MEEHFKEVALIFLAIVLSLMIALTIFLAINYGFAMQIESIFYIAPGILIPLGTYCLYRILKNN